MRSIGSKERKKDKYEGREGKEEGQGREGENTKDYKQQSVFNSFIGYLIPLLYTNEY